MKFARLFVFVVWGLVLLSLTASAAIGADPAVPTDADTPTTGDDSASKTPGGDSASKTPGGDSASTTPGGTGTGSGAAADPCAAHKNCGTCVAVAACSWCEPKVGTTKLGLGYCSTHACNKSVFGTLYAATEMAGKAWTLDTIKQTTQCGTTSDQNSPLQPNVKDCAKCGETTGQEWCRMDFKAATIFKGSGGVCLTVAVDPKCAILTSTIVAQHGESFAKDHCPASEKCQEWSCQECRKKRCSWCRMDVKDKTSAEELLKSPLGACSPMPTAVPMKCPSVVFGEKLPTVLSYKMKNLVYEIQNNFDDGDTCKVNDMVDSEAVTSKSCTACMKDAKNRWCQIETAGVNDKGGFCAGLEANKQAEKLCGPFTVAAKTDVSKATKSTLLQKCGGAVKASAVSTSLVAAALVVIATSA